MSDRVTRLDSLALPPCPLPPALPPCSYTVVKEHAKSEWLLLRAKLIMEIENGMDDDFYADKARAYPL